MDNEQNKPITVFISYSWDSEEHKAWVRMLADRLTEQGIDVILDKKQADTTSSVHFMQRILTVDKVLIIGTPSYKDKVDSRSGGVAYEDLIINIEIKKDLNTSKFIPILREGSLETSFTIVVSDRLWVDFRKDDNFEDKFSELLDRIHGKPLIQISKDQNSQTRKIESPTSDEKIYKTIQWHIHEEDNLVDGTYIGSLHHGHPNGKGQFISKEGMKYYGEFKDGMFHGRGILVNAHKEAFLGDFENGRFIRGKINSNGFVEYLRGNFTWRRTCSACPEQYDVYYKHKYVAYVRLRFGVLTVIPIVKSRDGKEVPDIKKILYRHEYKNDEYKGRFDEWELEEHQDDIEKNILKEIKQ